MKNIILVIILVAKSLGCYIQSGSNCSFCGYQNYSASQILDSTVRPWDANCQAKNMLAYYSSEVFIGTQPCGTRTCLGTQGDPYDNLISALKNEMVKAQGYMNGILTFNLIVGSHFVTSSDFNNFVNIQFFRRQLWTIILKPINQNIPSDGQTTFINTQQPIIYLKTDSIYFFVSNQFIVYNIIFDGSDLQFGFQQLYQNQSNLKTLICVNGQSQIGCQMNAPQFSQTYLNNRLFSLFNLETILDLQLSYSGANFTSFDPNNVHYPVFPPIPTLKLINVNIRNMYTGIVQTTQQMQGFRGLILSNLGPSVIFLNSLTIQQSFFPDGLLAKSFPDSVYQSDPYYLKSFSDITLIQNTTLLGFNLNSYNQWMVGSQLYQTNQPQPTYYNVLFDFENAFSIATINNALINNNTLSAINNNQFIYGYQILIFRGQTAGQISFSGLTFQDNTNYVLVSIEGGVSFFMGGSSSLIQRSLIKNDGFSSLAAPQYFLIVNNQVSFMYIFQANLFNLTSTVFQQLTGNVIYILGSLTFITQVTFQNINLPINYNLIQLNIGGKGLANIDQSTFAFIQGVSVQSSRFVYIISSQNQLNLTNSQIHDCQNISIADNTEINYSLHLYSLQVYNMVGFAICLRNRYSVMNIYFCNFHDIQTPTMIVSATQSAGGNPVLNVVSCNFTNILAYNLFSAQTVNPRQYFTSTIITNFQGTSSLIDNCCYGLFGVNSLTLINVEAPIILNVGQVYFAADSIIFQSPTTLTFLPNNHGPVFINVLKETTVRITNSQFNLYSGASMINVISAELIVFQNTFIYGKNLGPLFNIEATSSFIAQNVTLVDLSLTSPNMVPSTFQYILMFSNVHSISIQNLVINNTNQYGLINQQNSDQLSINQLVANNIQCGRQSCFSSSNQVKQTIFNNCQFFNLSTTSGSFMDFSFSAGIIIVNCLFNNILVSNQDNIISVFQAAVVINSTVFKQTQQLTLNYPGSNYLTAFSFQNSDSLSIFNLTVDNSLSSSNNILVASFETLLVNMITIEYLTINTAITITQPLVYFEEFSNLSIIHLNTLNIISQSSIIEVQTSFKNLLISFQGISCKNNTGLDSSCLYLITDSNFQISQLSAENTFGSIIAVESTDNASISLTSTRIKMANNSLTQSPLNRMFSFKVCSITISDFIVWNAYDSQSLFYIMDTTISIFALQFLEVYSVDIFNLQNKQNLYLNIFDLTDSVIFMDRCTYMNNETLVLYNQANHISLVNTSRIAQQSQGQILNTHLAKSKNSQITIVNSLINGLSGTIIQTIGNMLIIQNSYFIANIAATYFNTMDTNLNIGGTTFSFSSCQNFFQSSNSLPLSIQLAFQNCEVDFGLSGSLGYLTNFQNITLVNATFQAIGVVGNTPTQGLSITNFKNIIVQNNFFGQLQNIVGGCLNINTPPSQVKDFRQISIQNTIFSYCQATQMGGSIYLEGQIIGSINSSSFYRNVANIGGGIVYNAPQQDYQNDSLIIENCVFSANYAKRYAGSTMNLNQFFKTSNNTYMANMAVSQANDGTFASQIGNLGVQNSTYIQQIIDDPLQVQGLIQRQLFEVNQNDTIIIASGQVYTLAVALLDRSGKPINVDQNSKIFIQVDGAGLSTLINNGFNTSYNGVVMFSQLSITHQPGQSFTLKFSVNFAYGKLDNSSQILYNQQNFIWNYFSRLCIIGEIYTTENTCQVCALNTYSLPDPQDPRLNSQSCQYCPAQALCIQEAIYPKYGFWIMSQTSGLVLQCKTPFYCLGKEDLYQARIQATGFELDHYVQQTSQMYSQQCIFGQAGVLCEECIQGYFKFSSNTQCLPCQGNKALTYFVIIIIIALLMAYSIYQSNNYMSKNQEGQDQAILIKIFLNYFQTLSLLGSASLKWSNHINSVFSFSSDFFGTQFNFVSVQCLTLGSTFDPATQFYINLAVQMSIPFIIFTLNCVYFVVTIFIAWKDQVQKKQNNSNDHKQLMRSKQNTQHLKSVSLYVIVLNGVVCLHLFYPLLTSTPTQLFYCETIATDTFGNTIQYLSKNLHIECWTKQFNLWFYSFGILLSVFFGLGIPSLLCFYMWTYKHELKELDNTALSLSASLRKKSQQKKNVVSSSTEKQSGIKLFVVSPAIANSVVGTDFLKDQIEKNQDSQKIIKQSHDEMSKINSMKSQKSLGVKNSEKKSQSRLETLKKINKASVHKSATRNLHKQAKRKELKQSEVFLFLIDPYKSKVFYWEIVVLLRKFVLIMIGLLTGFAGEDPNNQSVKYLLLNIYLIVFFRLNLKYEPFFSPIFNLAENYSFMVVIMSCLSGIITSVFDSIQAEVISDIIFFIVNPLYVMMMAFIFYSLQMHADPQLFQKQPKWIKQYIQIVFNKHKQRVANIANSSRLDDEPSMKN